MSRRSGRCGYVCIRGKRYVGRYRADVPGQNKRVRRTVIIGSIDQFTRPKAERWLSKFIEAEGINDASHLALSQSSVVTLGLAARGCEESSLVFPLPESVPIATVPIQGAIPLVQRRVAR